MDHLSGAMESLGKSQKEMLEIKNTATEMKSAVDGLINSLDMAKERISELKTIWIETSRTEKQKGGKKKKKDWKNRTKYPRTVWQLEKV